MNVNILVVDDSTPMRAVIIRMIKASGLNHASFFEACTGREALQRMQQQWLDLVISDYNMPEMDGLELLREMKTDDILKSIPFLVVTTEGSPERVAEFMQSGAAGYIHKPFTPEVIRAKLTQILGEVENGACIESGDEVLDF